VGRSPIGVVYWVCLASSCILSSYHSFGFREKWTGGVIGGLVRRSKYVWDCYTLQLCTFVVASLRIQAIFRGFKSTDPLAI